MNKIYNNINEHTLYLYYKYSNYIFSINNNNNK